MDVPRAITHHPERVLIAAPYGKDGELLVQVLRRGGIESSVCRDVDSLVELFREGAGAALVADEALNGTNIPLFAEALAEQPQWSDFPLLLLTGGGDATRASRHRLNLLAPLGNVTLVERPIRTATLLSTVQTALRARRRQYQIKDQLEQQHALMETIRESEAKLKFALEAAQLGAWELSIPTHELTCSEQFLQTFGRIPQDNFNYTRFRDLIHAEDRERVLQNMDRAFTSGVAYNDEYRIAGHDGRSRWVWAAGRPIPANGSHGRLVGVALDVTERKQGEAAIRESESQLRALANSMPQLAWMANNDGHLFWYNERWYEYTGTTFEQMKGWGWQSVHDPEILPNVLERWQESIASGRTFEMEFPLRSSTGQFRWFLTQSRPILDAHGEVVRWFGTNTDVDDKKRAEKALRESEELARSIIQNSPDCVEVIDPQGKTLLVNSAGCRLAGQSTERLQQTNWIDAWREEDRATPCRALNNALHGKASTFQDVSRIGWGENRVREVSVTPILDDAGRVTKILCVSRDITQRLRAEEELRQTAKLESLGVMAGGIAHDFNNLLTGILGNASLLSDLPDPEDRQLARDIVTASERAADLTRQMLAYSGKGRFQVRSIDLSAQVREILRLVKPMIDKTVELELNLSDNLSRIEADPGQTQQLIMNLVINGAEAMGGAPGRVIITTSTIEIDEAFISHILTLDEITPGKYVCLEVQDTGCGMSEETKAKIFDPFFTTKFTGRGLGLAAVSGIVRGHRGALRVYSSPGEGTTFKVFLPAEDVHEVIEQPADTKDDTARGTVLLVDDEEVVRRIGHASLKRKGYEVLLAANGKEAIETLRSQPDQINLVILDMTMPVMGGEETLSHLRAIRPDILVIVCSGYNEVEVIRRFTRQGVASFLQKPYTAAALTRMVGNVLEGGSGKSTTAKS